MASKTPAADDEKALRNTLQQADRLVDPWLRKEAIDTLAALKTPRALPVLRRATRASHNVVRAAAADALGKLAKHEVFDDLLPLLDDVDYLPRQHAAQALGALRDPRAVEPLLRHLRAERDGYVVAALIEALGMLGPQVYFSLARPPGSAPVPLLLDFAQRYPKRVEDTLMGMGPDALDDLVAALEPKARAQCCVAVRALGRIGDPEAIPPLLKIWRRTRSATLLRTSAQALNALRFLPTTKRGGESLRQWMLLARGDWDGLLGRGQMAEKTLIAALRDESVEVRRRAAQGLAIVGTAAAVAPLLVAMKGSASSAVVEAIKALGALGDRRAVEPLVRLAKRVSRDHWTGPVTAAIAALAELADQDAAPTLRELAQPEMSLTVRQEALRALAAFGSEETVALLQSALNDGAKKLREAAADALQRLGRVPSKSTERVRFFLACGATDALALEMPRLQPTLIQLLSEEAAAFQEGIAVSLAQGADENAIEPLLNWFVAHPTLIADDAALERWCAQLERLFGALAKEVLLACSFAARTTEIVFESSSTTETRTNWDLSRSDTALEVLCTSRSPIAKHVLQAIAAKADVEVEVRSMETEWGGGENLGTLSFARQRARARMQGQTSNL